MASRHKYVSKWVYKEPPQIILSIVTNNFQLQQLALEVTLPEISIHTISNLAWDMIVSRLYII